MKTKNNKIKTWILSVALGVAFFAMNQFANGQPDPCGGGPVFTKPYLNTSQFQICGQFFGTQATGRGNLLLGFNAGQNIPNPTVPGGGINNTFLGINAGQTTITQHNNTFVGFNCGQMNTGFDNTFMGLNSGMMNQGYNNVFLGNLSGERNTIGHQNVFIGYQSGQNNTTGVDNVCLGYTAGFGDGKTQTIGIGNTFVGQAAGRQCLPPSNLHGYNTFIGNAAGFGSTNGYDNTFLGSYAGLDNEGGLFNVYVGMDAAAYVKDGVANTIVGFQAGGDGTYKNCVGPQAPPFDCGILGGKYNSFFGELSGKLNATSGENNTFIGHLADGYITAGDFSNTIDNSTAIGANAVVRNDNHMILGDNNVYVGIGLSNDPTGPQNKLEINTTAGSPYFGSINGSSGLKFRNLTSLNTPGINPGTGVLSVDNQGNVILVQDQTGGGGGGCCITADNGLTLADNHLEWDGPLHKLTDITMNSNHVGFPDGAGEGSFGIGYNSGTAALQTGRLAVRTSTKTAAGSFLTDFLNNAGRNDGIRAQVGGSSIANIALSGNSIDAMVGSGQNIILEGNAWGSALNRGVVLNVGNNTNGERSFGVDVTVNGSDIENRGVNVNLNSGSGLNYGVFSQVNSPNGQNFAIWAEATAHSNDEAGHFEGNVVVTNRFQLPSLPDGQGNGRVLTTDINGNLILVPDNIGSAKTNNNESLTAELEATKAELEAMKKEMAEIKSCLAAMNCDGGISETTLNQNIPNPFADKTIISYSLAEKSNVELNVYSIQGVLITTLTKGEQEAGSYSVDCCPNNELAPGSYIYVLKANGVQLQKKAIVIK